MPADVCDKDVVSAYREAAKRLHPDRGGDKESFQRLQSAYSQVRVNFNSNPNPLTLL